LRARNLRSGWYPYVPAILALLVFLIYFFQIRGHAFVRHLVANPLVYHDQADQILRSTPPTRPFFLSPLYPAFVALVYSFTRAGRTGIILCQGVLLAINVWLVGRISHRLLGLRTALVGSLIMVFYWSFYYFAGELLPTTLYLTFLLVGVYAFIRRDESVLPPAAVVTTVFAGVLFLVHAVPGLANTGVLLGRASPAAPSSAYLATLVFFLVFASGTLALLAAVPRARWAAPHKNLIASGMILGTSMLVWSGTALLIVAFALKLLFGRVRGRQRAGLFILGLSVPLVASLAHNYAVSGRTVPVTSSFGVNFFIGNNTESDGMDPFSIGKGDAVRIEADRLALGGAARSAFYRDRALESIKADPAAWLKLVGRKLVIAVARTEIDNNADISERRSAWSHVFVPILNFGLVFPLAAVGILQALLLRREQTVLVLGYAAFVAVEVGFFGCERFRMPALVFMIPLAALGIECVLRDVVGRNLNRIAVWSIVIAGTALASNIDFLGISDLEFASITVNKAHVQRLEGNLDEARRLLAAALEREPDNAGAYFQLGAIEEQEGRLRQAAAYFMTSLERDPFYYGSYAGMKRLLDQANIRTTYLDSYVANLIEGGGRADAEASLLRFIEERLP
jgi:tetratricopeptide (TPR) repeat protein